MGRNLIVCCDGTWNTPEQKDRGVLVPTNVAKLAQAVDRADPNQHIFYDIGLGTGKGWDYVSGGLFGIGLTKNIQQAYRWIADEYHEEDRLFFFGFSRGAYTVRSLAGLIGRCGLTAAGDERGVTDAYNLYRQASDDAGRARAAEFKAKRRQPSIYFLGVWDTVGSLGVPALSRYGLLRKLVRHALDGSKFAHGFHDETLGKHVTHAYQALAIDERRGAFEPSVWKADATPRANVEQVWFSGAHANVGGGYADAGLSDIALSWMVSKATAAGLRLKTEYLTANIHPNADGELRDEFVGVYKVLPSHVRQIGRPDTLNEKIHKSAIERMTRTSNHYQPENLTTAVAGAAISEEGFVMSA